ncbi:alpha/beta fold hydrolase [uncultured Friedmanniella sp.]|uniref:alpha/beta fold hydrolase n=1 Tax=uncultured Friedmanniella sp. TaxID=335381 RepID=UPI0035C99FB1
MTDRSAAARALSRSRGTRSAVFWLALLCGFVGSWLLPVPANAAVPVVETVFTVPGTPETDGRPVDLDVTLLTTSPTTPQPAVVLAHGFGGTKADSLPVGRDLARAGYTVIAYTARGFGASGGTIHLDAPAYEGADAKRLVDFAATRPEVRSTDGDPVIGFAGASYGGALSLVAAALDPRIDAVVPAFTWNSLVQSLFPQDAVTGAPVSLADVSSEQPGVFKQRWASLFFLSGSAGGTAGRDALCGRFDPTLCRAYLRTAQTGRPDAELVRLLGASGPAGLLSQVRAPTLLLQGEQDTLFPLDQADANLRGLPAGTPARMSWVEGGHDASVSVTDQLPLIESWFGRYLKDDHTPADSSFSVVVPQTSLVTDTGNEEPTTLVAPAYPGRGAPATAEAVTLTGPPQSVLSPPGGTPAALTSLPGTGGVLAAVAGVAGYGLGVLPGRSATFTTAPLTSPRPLVGSGRVELEVTSSTSAATLFVSLWDLGPDAEPSDGATPDPSGQTATPSQRSSAAQPSSAVLPGGAVAPVRLAGLTPGRPERVQVALPTVAHQVPVGHRLQVVVSSTDQAYAVPAAAAVYQVALAPGSPLSLPRLTAEASGGSRLRVPLALVLAVGLLVLAAVAALVLSWLRRRARHPRPDLAGLPLAVEGLVKTYGDGFRAVDGVSFSAGPGQVVGLLGPNGAGKTTTMRMLVGLIRPDAGEVYVGGEPVHAGSDVLGSVGALIEGPGFLPHLTGRENLAAYWQATGRPLADAHLDEALAIADLGGGLDRRVRGYSQGMRQRLGIAQAMLGRPRLLLLDEPTNGLDPPQILAMRTVLAEYAAGGRTVLVSSHLLSEVEQSCSHVVVMNRGRVVLTGSMEELTATDDVTLVGLTAGADVGTARSALAGLGLVVALEDGLLRVSGDAPRAGIVAALVGAGVGVESVDGRRQLEEVFMSLVGAPGAAPREDEDG